MSPETAEPSHYVYVCADKEQLYQGDVLERTKALSAILNEFHPYFAEHPSYTHFLVLTQSCDLVRRDGQPPKAPYIALAAVRPVTDALLRRAQIDQAPWQISEQVIGHKLFQKLSMFTSSLLNNNQPDFFYLHKDYGLGLSDNCCAFLNLSVPIKAEHYDTCLDAKRVQLAIEFQAKLGWLVGSSFSRVGTGDWDEHYFGHERCESLASRFLKETFHSYSDRQLSQAVKKLASASTLESLSPEEIHAAVKEERLIKPKQLLKSRIMARLDDFDLPAKVRSIIKNRVQASSLLRMGITQAIEGVSQAEAEGAGGDLDGVGLAIMETLSQVIDEACGDQNSPEWAEIRRLIAASIVADPALPPFRE